MSALPPSKTSPAKSPTGMSPLARLGQGLLLCGWITCLLLGPISLLRALSPALAPAYLEPLVFLAAAFSMPATGLRQARVRQGMGQVASRLVEYVVLLVAVWFVTLLLGRSGGIQGRGWREIFWEPGLLLDGEFLLAGGLGAGAWGLADWLGSGFRRLNRVTVRARAPTLAPDAALRAGEPLVDFDRQAFLESLSAFFFWGALVLCACAALLIVVQGGGPGALPTLRDLPLPVETLVALVGYFLGGVLLFSVGHLSAMRFRWALEGADVARTVPARWLWLAVAAAVIVGAVASLLPLGSTLRPGQALLALVAVVAQAVWGLLFLLGFALAWLMRFLGWGAGTPEMPSQTPVPPPSSPEVPVAGGLGLLVRSLAFWTILALVLGYSLVAFGRTRGLSIHWPSWKGLWAWLRARLLRPPAVAWRRLAARLGRAPTAPGQRPPPWEAWLRLGVLSPAERVRYYYLATVRRASRLGTVRTPWQSPADYLAALQRAWPEAGRHLARLTERFLLARYSRRAVTRAQAEETRRVWEEIKRLLRPPGTSVK